MQRVLRPAAQIIGPPGTNEAGRNGDLQFRAMSLVFRELDRSGWVSANKLLVETSGSGNGCNEALRLLKGIGVLEPSELSDRCHYSLRSIEEGGPKEFLVLGSSKKVSMSPDGNRAVRVRIRLMAARRNVACRPCGSLIYSDKTPAPKFRLGPAWRIDPIGGKKSAMRFDVVKREKNDMVFKLNFEPTLSPGEVVDYGFYIWTRNHYAMTHKEVVEKYNDEWSREGFNVSDPSLFLEILVELPDGYHYREARAEKNPVLTRDGPNVPGAVISTFRPNERTLVFQMERPGSGNYFVSWKPP